MIQQFPVQLWTRISATISFALNESYEISVLLGHWFEIGTIFGAIQTELHRLFDKLITKEVNFKLWQHVILSSYQIGSGQDWLASFIEII